MFCGYRQEIVDIWTNLELDDVKLIYQDVMENECDIQHLLSCCYLQLHKTDTCQKSACFYVSINALSK